MRNRFQRLGSVLLGAGALWLLHCGDAGYGASTDPESGGFGNFNNNQDGDGDAGSGGECASIEVKLDKVIPTVAMLIDQSGSMKDDFGGQGARWNVVRDALISPQDGLIKQLDNDVEFGLALYTWNGGNNDPSCPTLRGTNLGFKTGNYQAISDFYKNETWKNDTPTGDSIDKLIGYKNGTYSADGFAKMQTAGPKYIVLATDGNPDSCENTSGSQQAKDEAIAAAQRAYSQGIKLFIIAVGNGVSLDHQQEMANAGAGQDPKTGNAPYFSTNNKAELVDALQTVVYGARDCNFTLDGEVKAGTEDSGNVTLDGNKLGYQDPNGWRLNSPTEIEFLGSSCQAIKTGSPNIQVVFPCGAVNTNPR